MSAQVDLIDRDGGVLTAKRHAIVTSAVVNGMGIYHGCEATKASASTIHLDAGWATIYGRLIEVQEQTFNVTLPSSGTLRGRLYCVVDLANTNNMCDIVVETGSTLPALPDDPDMNYTTGKSAFEICRFNVGPSQITDPVMTAPNRSTSYASIDDFKALINSGNSSGYFTLPNGIHIEIGKATASQFTSNAMRATVIWQVPFDAPPIVMALETRSENTAGTLGENLKADDITTTGAKFYVNNISGVGQGWTRTFNYIAIGK